MTGEATTTSPSRALPSPGRERSDEELAEAAQAGDAAAFDELVERFEAPLFRYLLMRTGHGSDAEELVQETFLRAWENLGRYRSRWRFSTWIYTLTKRLAVSHLRRAGVRSGVRGTSEGLEALPEEQGDPSAIASREEERARLWELASRVLGPDERSALWLRYAEERGTQEIAHILGRRRVTVRVLLFRAREKLARRLAHRAQVPGRAGVDEGTESIEAGAPRALQASIGGRG